MALDLAALSATIAKFGGKIIMKRVNTFAPSKDFLIYKNVKTPIALPKLSTAGEPRPYRKNEDYDGNNAVLGDRILTAYQSKWDHTMDPEDLRNKYLAEAGVQFDPNNMAFWQYFVEKFVKDYLAAINNKTVLPGIYNSAGTGAVDLADGLAKYIGDAVTAGDLSPVLTGTFDSTNAVTKVEQVANASPAWMREEAGFKIICSHTAFQAYKNHYRTINPFGYESIKGATDAKLDNFNAILTPRSYMGTSLGLLAVAADETPLAMGTDGDSVAVHATPLLNTIKLRLMMPIGFQLADTDAVIVNDQF